jgi:DNA-binding protein HU-beta
MAKPTKKKASKAAAAASKKRSASARASSKSSVKSASAAGRSKVAKAKKAPAKAATSTRKARPAKKAPRELKPAVQPAAKPEVPAPTNWTDAIKAALERRDRQPGYPGSGSDSWKHRPKH